MTNYVLDFLSGVLIFVSGMALGSDLTTRYIKTGIILL